ncbi:hypothetical protein CAEBREN_19100 [Caenorhabditis brenneri]|uniref:Matrix-remodeling-associated protein 7 helical domain-containing protein n=1 Tax=Caenorhabditis brenneri TaxID=135651 RepID=G0MB70_CAEBE|nr:hypothetical protein CAEBREN_19100 [Caenorhabditis brenneri]
MSTTYSSEEYAIIGFTILGGALFGLFMFYLYQKKRNTPEDDQFKGRMNTTGIKKNRVIFSPEVCENELPSVVTDDNEDKTDSETNSDEQEDEEETEGDEEEEEQMPQFNNRKIKNTQNFDAEAPSTSDSKETTKELSDGDKINATLGKLHGKLATAQLKAKTRQIAAEMSEQEKEYEAQMTNNQMESIMNLMMQNKEKFGMSSDDIKEQLNLYNF